MGAAILGFLANGGATIVVGGALAFYHLFKSGKKSRSERIKDFFVEAYPAVEGLAKKEGWGAGAGDKKWAAALNMVKEAMQLAGLGTPTDTEVAEGKAMIGRMSLAAKR